ncbi:MAG: hypothetical protein COV47_03550 [Candidatus Diapherotrites archaeon CG11_big_fil_rev_8_21_14_0_20_37_9]|nr:MAG: hypothetical protein COV47_03550 [Candidatus Diapherotrites archaeon CG11_big_fil_rev_8_21_14_0_20_37_9]
MIEELTYIDKKLHFSGVDLNALETPKFVFSKKQLQLSYKKVTAKFDEIFEKNKVYYSLKTNKYPFVIETLKGLGANFVISSVNEAKLIISHGVSPERCLVNQPLYTEKDIRTYLEMGFGFFALGHEKFLGFIEKHAKKKVCFVADIDLVVKEHTFSFQKEDLLRVAKKYSKAELVGIAFYVKTQNTEVFIWQSYIAKALKLIKELESAGIKIEFVNIGSGFPVEYNKSGLDGLLVLDRVKNTFASLSDYTVILEPGRIIVASCVVLVASVMLVKGKDVWLNTSVYNSYLDTPISKIKLPCMNAVERKKELEYNVYGNSPCTLDVYFKDKPIGEVKEGDKLVFYNAGAYIFMIDFASNNMVSFYNEFDGTAKNTKVIK